MSNNEQQKQQQIPSLFSFGNTSTDALNLSNYVDQIFNEEPVDQIPIPLSTVSSEDQKLDNKLNINCDNATLIGGENLRAYAYPGDVREEIDLVATYTNGNLYTAEIAGWLVLENTQPQENDYLKVRNITNEMVAIDTYNINKDILQVKLPVSKYQVVEVTYSGIDSVATRTLTAEAQQKIIDSQAAYDAAIQAIQEVPEDQIPTIEIPDVYVPTEDDYIVTIDGIPEGLACYFIASGTQSNIGETLIQTRDYKDIMAGIGFPDNTKVEDVSLPNSGESIYVENDCYFSIAVVLAENDYFSMYTEFTGVDLVYTLNTLRVRRAILAVPGNTTLTVEYSLSNLPTYFKQINPKGRAI